MRFSDRKDAGKQLAEMLGEYKSRKDVIILALPRGGVPVAREVARVLHLPFDVWIVRKLGVPGHEEVAMGAIALGCDSYIDHGLIERLGISEAQVETVLTKELKEMRRRNTLYRDDKPVPAVEGKTVILIDDGIATGATMRVSALSLREIGAKEIIMATPLGSKYACRELEDVADRVICLYESEPFYGVGAWYQDFSQIGDEEVIELLENQPWTLEILREAS